LQIPQIQIRQQYARIGIDADPGRLEMRQPAATLEMRTTKPKVLIEQPKGDLHIDQSKAWDALGLGGSLHVMDTIYSSARDIAMQGIAKIVDRGNRLAAIHEGGNPIADIGLEASYRFREYDFAGEASFDNVDIRYTARKSEIKVEEGAVQIESRPNRPEIAYHRGKLDVYLLQRGQLTITPPQLDVMV